MIGRRSYFVLAVIVSWAFLTPDGLAAQNCNYCHPCAGGIYTSPGASPWPVLYVDQSSCMAYEEGCEGLIPCGGGTEEDAEDVLAAIDSGDWSELGRLAKANPGVLEFLPERGVVLVRSCGRVTALRQVGSDAAVSFWAQAQ